MILREKKLPLLKDLLKRIRDTGALVGLSVHDPLLLRIVEEEAGTFTLHGGAV